MLMLSAPSATFDERLIQRSGSGETENSSSTSGLATPQDENVQQLGSVLESKHAAKTIATRMERMSSLQSRKESQQLKGVALVVNGEKFTRVPPALMARMKSSASISNLSQSPEFEAPEVTHNRAGGVYSLPNRHISIEIQEHNTEGTSDSLGPGGANQSSMGIDSLFNRNWSREDVIKAALRMVLFLPWCIAVGGSIVLCPSKLDTITFRTGYLEPLFGIHRFAHWADRTFEHIVIFITFIGFLAWLSPVIGVLAGCAVGALALNTWSGFRVDPNVPLGEDDKQSVYLSITKFWLADEFLNLRREDKGFLLDDR
ncbi:hypothetical protein NP233_g5962 [Leucocoprinus birnbaumii]|uniref:Uncharacterized protein n=1 Tax=Leucocoprinus birnbaumii TaxID=56174 RepID=A0AAD5VXP4_9AGAR|nr:hypothetical protein NP233_g5962 [Leucocoprinus birnbaumii]